MVIDLKLFVYICIYVRYVVNYELVMLEVMFVVKNLSYIIVG